MFTLQLLVMHWWSEISAVSRHWICNIDVLEVTFISRGDEQAASTSLQIKQLLVRSVGLEDPSTGMSNYYKLGLTGSFWLWHDDIWLQNEWWGVLPIDEKHDKTLFLAEAKVWVLTWIIPSGKLSSTVSLLWLTKENDLGTCNPVRSWL